MANWLCIINDTNFKILKEKKIWGVRDRHAKILAKVRKGDNLLFYITGLSEISGIFEVTEQHFISKEKIFDTEGFDAEETFQHRLEIKEIGELFEKVNFKRIAPKLDLFPQKDVWYTYLRGKAIISLSNHDYKLILEAVNKIQ